MSVAWPATWAGPIRPCPTPKSAVIRIVQFDHFCFEQNPFGWLESFYNALGLRKNLFCDLLKTQSARTPRAMERPVQTLVMCVLLPVLLPLSVGLTILEAGLRRGGTIEVYAVREET